MRPHATLLRPDPPNCPLVLALAWKESALSGNNSSSELEQQRVADRNAPRADINKDTVSRENRLDSSPLGAFGR